KAADVSFFVELATTASRVVVRRQALCFGTSHVTGGLFATAILTGLKFVFGSTFAPTVFTFFVSWLSDAITIAAFFFLAALIFGAFDGMTNRTSPVVGS